MGLKKIRPTQAFRVNSQSGGPSKSTAPLRRWAPSIYRATVEDSARQVRLHALPGSCTPHAGSDGEPPIPDSGALALVLDLAHRTRLSRVAIRSVRSERTQTSAREYANLLLIDKRERDAAESLRRTAYRRAAIQSVSQLWRSHKELRQLAGPPR